MPNPVAATLELDHEFWADHPDNDAIAGSVDSRPFKDFAKVLAENNGRKKAREMPMAKSPFESATP
eukprot:6854153-Pyramimonas_sp.AAC.1